MTDKQELQQALQALAVHYAAELPAKIAEIESRMQSLLGGNADSADLRLLHRQLHSLHGSAKTFGFPAVSESARELEAMVGSLIGGRLDAAAANAGGELLAKLLTASQVPNNLLPVGGSAAAVAARNQATRLIYLVEDDPRTSTTLGQQLKSFGYTVLKLNTVEELANAFAREAPSALIAELKFSDHAQRAHDGRPVETPLIFVSEEDSMETRLQAARAGGDAFFAKPVRIGPLVDRLDALLNPAASEPYRILVVEDSAEQAEFYSAILRDAGMRTHVVTDPLCLVEALNDFNPELVLMDMYLPDCTGDELAQVIRQNASFMSLPIVFLSVEQDFDRQLRAMFRGGDEFLTKPISPQHLALVATSRVERYRELRVLMLHDSLTGLVNHSRLQQQLEIESARALRQHQSLSLAMIDIDHFKEVNDRHGHQTGDRVLKNLARFLRQRLRASDVIGRYGGEEFAVILADTTGEVAEEVINSLRRDFAAIPHETGSEAMTVTFSAGIASLANHASVRELILAADQALYKAKSSGRNRVARNGG